MRKSLGSYKILRKIGSGGMGEVYAAEDPKLERQVALKVLPDDMALQAERVQRFEREAKAVASLDHPNIVTIFSVEEDEGVHFLTMQLVEGETLEERLPRHGMSLERFFDLAIPLADAISAAHEHGITHRDLKPANIMVTKEGRVKVLDFGLAKLREETLAEGPTVVSEKPLTEEGKILGTVAYMSPEQAEGKAVDHRSDIFSLGIVLYEMATGERPFKGDTKVSVLSSIVKDSPTSVTELNATLPRHLGRIVRRCLAKDPEQRYQTAKDIRNELVELKREIDSGETALPQAAWNRKGMAGVVVGALVVALAMVFVLPRLASGSESGRLEVEARPITDRPGIQAAASISPEGRRVVYMEGTFTDFDIFEQRIGGSPRNLTEDHPGIDISPVFDPTGERIAFNSERQGGGLFVMGASGEVPHKVSSRGFDPAWSPDGKKLICTDTAVHDPYWRALIPPGRLWIVDVETGTEELLFDGIDAVGPSWSPNGTRIAFWSLHENRRNIWTIPASGGEPVAVTRDEAADFNPFWSPDGEYLNFCSDRGGKPELWRVPIDEDSGETRGDPELVWAPDSGRIPHASISADGKRIACTLARVDCKILRAPFDPVTGQLAGPEEVIYSTREHDLTSLDISPDGSWLSFATQHGVEDLALLAPDGGEPIWLTQDAYKDRQPTWYPISDDQGGWLTFYSNRVGDTSQIWAIRPNRTLHQLTEGPNTTGPTWWPDGERLSVSVGGTRRVYQFFDGLTGGPSGSPARASLYVGDDASWSPNGERVAEVQLGQLRITTVGSREIQIGEDEDGNPYNAFGQGGNRWLDDRRLIFWDGVREKAFLWDVEAETATEVTGIRDAMEFVFSRDGRTLFIRRDDVDMDIWLLELPG